MRLRLAALGAVVALAGCGGDDVASPGTAELAPPDAQAYLHVDTDLSSDQWERVQSLLDRFPAKPQIADLLRDEVLSDLGLDYEDDVEPGLGDTVALVVLSLADGDAVLLTQPEDDAKFDALARKLGEESGEDVVTGEVDGWRALAQNESAIAKLRDREGSLADDEDFRSAQEEAPDEVLAFGFVRGEAAADLGDELGQQVELEWASGYLEAREDGPAVGFTVRSESLAGGEPYSSERADEAPGDALAFLSFDADSIRDQTSALAPLTQILGIRVDDLLAGVQGEGALWVRPGTGFPEVTLVVETQEPDRARAALEELLGRLPLEVRVGVVEGRLVATTASSPEAALGRGGESLADSEDFAEAREVAGMPDETSGFLYVNVADTLPLLGLVAGLGGDQVPQSVLENLRPLRSVLAWSESDGPLASQTLFVHIQ